MSKRRARKGGGKVGQNTHNGQQKTKQYFFPKKAIIFKRNLYE